MNYQYKRAFYSSFILIVYLYYNFIITQHSYITSNMKSVLISILTFVFIAVSTTSRLIKESDSPLVNSPSTQTLQKS